MLTASDVMTRDVITVTPDTPVREIAQLLYGRRISGVPVLDASRRLRGIVSEGDLVGHVGAVGEQRRSWWTRVFADRDTMARDYRKSHGRTAADVMTENVFTVRDTDSVAEVARILERHRIKRVPVMSGERMVGIVTRNNLLQALATADVARPATMDDRALRDAIFAALARQSWASVVGLNVIVQNGVAHLSGQVDSEEQRRAVHVAVANVPGVTGVEDGLTVILPYIAAE